MTTAARIGRLVVGFGLLGTVLFGAPTSAPADDGLRPVAASGARLDDPFAQAHRLGALRDGDVLDLRLDRFPASATAFARQCDGKVCASAYPIVVGPDGATRAQLRVADSTAQGVCRQCVVEVRAGGVGVTIELFFGGPAPPRAQIVVTPDVGLAAAQNVEVRATSLRSVAGLLLCPIDDASLTRCAPLASGSHGERAWLQPDAQGAAAVRAGLPTGTDCSRDASCAVVARVDGRAVATAVPVRFARPPGADYDGTRVLVGLTMAALLALGAVLVVRRTDWSPTGEVRAPEIDDAELADLDAIVARLEQLEAPSV